VELLGYGGKQLRWQRRRGRKENPEDGLKVSSTRLTTGKSVQETQAAPYFLQYSKSRTAHATLC
jgi:hypothetical protein